MESVILSSWDHIMGPQIVKLWYVRDNGSDYFAELPCEVLSDFNMTKNFHSVAETHAISDLPDLGAYSVMCGQLLLGEVDSCKPDDEYASRFYLSESNILVSVVFHLNSLESSATESKADKNTCLCFGTIFSRNALKTAFQNQQVVDIHLRTAIGVLQNSKLQYDSVMKEVSAIVGNMVWILRSLKSPTIKALQPYELPSFQQFILSDLMSKAIVSHLQTSGYSVVIGASDFLINQVIYALSLFNSLDESSCSVITPDATSNSFIKGIYLHGAIKTTDVDYKCLAEKASKESFSLTIIDIDLGKVWQSICVKDSSDTFRNTLSPVLENGLMIPRLLKDLDFIQMNGGNSKNFIANFYECLMIEAASVIKAIEPLRNSTTTAKELMEMFGVDDIVDLKIIFGCAEKLKPGFRSIL